MKFNSPNIFVTILTKSNLGGYEVHENLVFFLWTQQQYSTDPKELETYPLRTVLAFMCSYHRLLTPVTCAYFKVYDYRIGAL